MAALAWATCPAAAATAALERPATEPREPRERPPLQRRAPRTPAPLPRLAGTFPVSTGRAESVFRPVAGRSPFQAVSPEGSRSLFQTVPAGPILTSVKGRRIATPQGRAMVWEREDATFILEVRPIRMADLFVKPEL